MQFKCLDKNTDPNIFVLKSNIKGSNMAGKDVGGTSKKVVGVKRGFSDTFVSNKITKEIQLIP